MNLYKLYIHQKHFSPHDLLINPTEHPDLKKGDVVEIYHPEDECCRLLLQITSFNNEDLKGREAISIESSIAGTFNLKTYSDVVMKVVDPAAVALDSVEITFKDQYMGRSEMWRLKTYLTNTCVYVNKKIEYCDKSIRCQVYEMWSQGDRVACGVITEDTKVVFRSSTSLVYLFIQMSSEMWDFDIHGDLYFEKAVNGFLTDLFMKWKKLGCNHEVTIVLFSRTYYAAKNLDEFPIHMRDCLQMDYKGRYYEDFYRVAIQNERNDDWSTVLVQLRKLFTAYQGIVLRYHDRENVKIPLATNSTAAQGNFLEVLNISLNAFEKHYLDRSFDRTGQLSVVITPGVGVFEVDRELTNITKQRIIDNGVGSDLVCVGEQPLHAVPLLKFHNKDTSLTAADDYSMPHWINLSFYSTNKKVAYSTFIPRIKLPPLVSAEKNDEDKENFKMKFLSCNQSEYIHNSLFDYDAYDAQIFQLPPAQGTCSLQRVIRAKKTSVPSLETYANQSSHDTVTPHFRRKMSDPDIHHGVSGVLSTLGGSPNICESLQTEKNARRSIVAIAPIVRPGRALINPFDPSHVTIKLTSNRRRWTHIFPKGPTGVLIQQHHYQAVPANNNLSNNNINYSNICGRSSFNSFDYEHTSSTYSPMKKSYNFYTNDDFTIIDGIRKRQSQLHSPAGPNVTVAPSKSLTYLWGATGEQEWTPALTTGVDWKSLTIPACLPITTDYFPDKRSLHNDYVVTDYTLLPDDVNSDYANSRAVYRKPLTTEEVFKEIVSQRLAQGFQLIVLEEKSAITTSTITTTTSTAITSTTSSSSVMTISNNIFLNSSNNFKTSNQSQLLSSGGGGGVNVGGNKLIKQSTKSTLLKIQPPNEVTKEYLLSIGRIFHKISLSGSVITVTGYRPRHPYPPINVDYRYRFHAPHHDTYEISGVNFTTEKLENFNWNYMDHYICTRGDTDYPLLESLKYWRYRMYLLPKEHPAMKKILEGASTRCDIYTDIVADNPKQQIEEFLRYVETHLNKIKRLQSRKARGSPTTQQSHLTRRRHSTSIISRPPPNQHVSSRLRDLHSYSSLSLISRTGSKPIETRPRISPAAEAAGISLNPDMNINDDNDEAFLDVKFKSNATLLEIFEAMKNPLTGITFMGPTQSLPSMTFVSYDALNWLRSRLDSSFHRQPLEILETMRKEKMICHASGDWDKPIIPGFYLYYIAIQDKSSKDYIPPLGDLSAFENEWMEVEVQDESFRINSDDSDAVKEKNIPNFLRDTPFRKKLKETVYKHSHLEIDVNQKSDRIEWGHAKYHSVMVPGYAFEIVIEWITASGPIVYDLVYGWCRKAHQCGFQLVPIPTDPLAEPFTEKSDPLRGPIFIPLNVECLSIDNNPEDFLFKEFNENTREDRMLLFQEAILQRFGFMPCIVENRYNSKNAPREYHYVHCSGNMFVLIRCAQQNIKKESPNPQESYITRLVYGHMNGSDVPRKTGFLWSWNHMIANKKWKSLVINCSPDGELFQLRTLKDFREFCSNQDQRLQNFWKRCWEQRNKIKNDQTGLGCNSNTVDVII